MWFICFLSRVLYIYFFVHGTNFTAPQQSLWSYYMFRCLMEPPWVFFFFKCFNMRVIHSVLAYCFCFWCSLIFYAAMYSCLCLYTDTFQPKHDLFLELINVKWPLCLTAQYVLSFWKSKKIWIILNYIWFSWMFPILAKSAQCTSNYDHNYVCILANLLLRCIYMDPYYFGYDSRRSKSRKI